MSKALEVGDLYARGCCLSAGGYYLLISRNEGTCMFQELAGPRGPLLSNVLTLSSRKKKGIFTFYGSHKPGMKRIASSLHLWDGTVLEECCNVCRHTYMEYPQTTAFLVCGAIAITLILYFQRVSVEAGIILDVAIAVICCILLWLNCTCKKKREEPLLDGV